jgi:hypothetical protein
MVRIRGLAKSAAAIALTACAVMLATTVHAGPGTYDGHWRGVEVIRGSGTGPYVTIVTLDVAQVPPRTIRDPVTYTASLRVYLNNGVPGVKTLPPRPPGSLPAEDRRPTLVQEPPMTLTGTGALGSDPEGEFLRVTVARPSGECGFFLSITRSEKRLYYQVLPQRSRCSGGRFAGMASSRGFLAR